MLQSLLLQLYKSPINSANPAQHLSFFKKSCASFHYAYAFLLWERVNAQDLEKRSSSAGLASWREVSFPLNRAKGTRLKRSVPHLTFRRSHVLHAAVEHERFLVGSFFQF